MKERILIPELMDDPNLDENRLKAALNDVSMVNNWLGGYQATFEGISQLVEKYPQQVYTIADMGCGDGEMLRKMTKYCRKSGINAQFVGFDLNAKSIELARERSNQFPEITFKQQDILELNERQAFDIITTTLTMHHFTNVEIVGFLERFEQLSRLGWVVNDLHRSKLAAALFKPFSALFMKTHIARYDGLVSIGRAFKKNELITFANTLGLKTYTLKWRWAFRYLWIVDSKAQK